MIALTTTTLDRLWPKAPHSLVDGMAATSEAALAKYGITTATELADFMAQCSEETGGGWDIEEDLNYTAARLCQVWPSRFPTMASAAPFAHNPRALADNVYGGRYGNVPGSEDGWNFRGRGAIQITFRSWYAQLSAATGLDLLNNPNLVDDPDHFLEVAAAFWKMDGVNAFADKGDFRGETLRVNGGLTNFALRQQWRAVWRKELGLDGQGAPAAVGAGLASWAQQQLLKAGFDPQGVDGDFGTDSIAALEKFQAAVGIPVSGELDANSVAALKLVDAPARAAQAQPMQQAAPAAAASPQPVAQAAPSGGAPPVLSAGLAVKLA